MLKRRLFSMLLVGLVATSAMADFVKGERHERDVARDVSSKPQQIINLMGISEGMVIGDVLGGGGYYSELLGEKVGPTGKVYLHNNQAYMPYVGKELEARLQDNRLPNVVRYDREVEDLTFKDNSLDAIFFVLGFHDMYHVSENWKIKPEDFIGQLKHALKPGGKILVIDHAAVEGSKQTYSQELHRIEPAFVKEVMLANGFSLVNESDILANVEDDKMMSPFDPKIRRKTERFVLIFQK